MPAGSFYRPTETDICQGDIFRDVPHVHFSPPVQVVREVANPPRGRPIWGLYPWPPEPGQQPALPKQGIQGGGFHLHPPNGESVSAFCQVAMAVALNHDCDLENEPRHRLVAMVYPITTVAQDEFREVIRQNRNYGRFHLPAQVGLIDESYVDLRRISCISPAFLDAKNRVATLSPDGMTNLIRQLFLFLVHRELRDEAFAPAE